MSNMARKNRGRTTALRRSRASVDGWDDTAEDPNVLFVPLNHQHDSYVMAMIEQVVAHHQLTIPEVQFFEEGVGLRFRSRVEAVRFREVSLSLPSIQIMTD